MRAIVRVCGLTAALTVACLSPTAATWPFGACFMGCTCYVSCPDGTHQVQVTQLSQCCGQVPRSVYTCPDGSDAFGYGFDDGSGAQFCTGL